LLAAIESLLIYVGIRGNYEADFLVFVECRLLFTCFIDIIARKSQFLSHTSSIKRKKNKTFLDIP